MNKSQRMLIFEVLKRLDVVVKKHSIASVAIPTTGGATPSVFSLDLASVFFMNMSELNVINCKILFLCDCNCH